MEEEDTGGYSPYHVGIIFASHSFAILYLLSISTMYAETAADGHCSGF
jgi:hypothetical protein